MIVNDAELLTLVTWYNHIIASLFSRGGVLSSTPNYLACDKGCLYC